MLPTDRISQLRKVELRSEEGVGGYHSLVEGSLQGGEVQTGEGQNCSVGSNIPPVVVNHQDQQMTRVITFARPGWFTEGGSGLSKHEGSPDKRWQTGGQVLLRNAFLQFILRHFCYGQKTVAFVCENLLDPLWPPFVEANLHLSRADHINT